MTIFILLNRVTYINTFDYYIISGYFDHLIIALLTLLWLFLSIRAKVTRYIASGIYGLLFSIAIVLDFYFILEAIALASVPVILFFLIINTKKKIVIQQDTKRPLQNVSMVLTANFLAIIGVIVGVASIIVSLVDILFMISIPIRHDYANLIFLIFSSFSPILILLLVFCFPVKLLSIEFLGGILKNKGKLNSEPLSSKEQTTTKKRRKKNSILYLSFFILLSIGLALIPHQPTINIDNQKIGSDSHAYINWLNDLSLSDNLQDLFRKAFIELQGGDRPLTLIFLFILNEIVNSNPSDVVEYFPVILGPALVLVTYILTRELTSDEIPSLLAAFLTAVASFHTLIGIYAGFYANWFALIFGYLSFVFLFRYLKTSRKSNLLIFSVLMFLLLFTHVYTWTILAIVMGIFLGAVLFFNYYPRKGAILLLLVILSSVIVDIARTTVTGSTGGIEKDLQITQTRVGVDQLVSRWGNLLDTTQHFLGSIYSNFIILVLALYWLLRSNLKVPVNIFLAIFFTVGILPIFLGDWVVQSRVFYNIPFQIPAGIGLAYIAKMKRPNGLMILMPVCIWLLAISVRTVSNFYFVRPS